MTEVGSAAAEGVVELALSGPPLLGPARLICVDGPAGSGKTTFATAVDRAARGRGLTVAVVHLDDVYAGWSGLADAGRRVREQLVEPLSSGGAAAYERYDWHQCRFTERVPVPPTDLLVVEGVGSGDPSYADRTSVLVWVWAPRELRLRRGLERDGPAMQQHWHRWLVDEQQLHLRDRTAERADVVVDGRSGLLSPGPTAGA